MCDRARKFWNEKNKDWIYICECGRKFHYREMWMAHCNDNIFLEEETEKDGNFALG